MKWPQEFDWDLAIMIINKEPSVITLGTIPACPKPWP